MLQIKLKNFIYIVDRYIDRRYNNITADDISPSVITEVSDMYGSQEWGALTETVYYILLSLFTPLHGYGIMQNVKELSQGRVNLGAGTLYGAISTLLDKGWIHMLAAEQDARKKEYVISNIGKAVVTGEISRLEELLENGKRVLHSAGQEVARS
jgi:DNA-binding PadR family transcriptional regulator